MENWDKNIDWFMKVILLSTLLFQRTMQFEIVLRVRNVDTLTHEQHQLTKEYYKPYVAGTEPLWTEPREYQVYDRMPAGWANAKAENFKEA